MITETLTLTLDLTKHEMEVPCDFGHWDNAAPEESPCDLPATWALAHSCCGVVVLRCEPHLQWMRRPPPRGRWECAECHSYFEDCPLYERYSSIERLK